MKKGLVSVISACYNKAAHIERFIRSIMKQEYRPIELIIMDDGSTDDSWSVIKKLESECSACGIRTKFMQQKNMGVGYAINACLRMVEGEFLCWPDCDDWFESNSVSKRVQFLRKHRRYSIVTSNADYFQEDDLEKPVGRIADDEVNYVENQFFLILNGKSIVCPGCHMVRTGALFKAMGGNQIFPSRYGQNLQILYPILYRSPRGFINEALYHYVVYNKSLSHDIDTFEKAWAHRLGRFQIKVETIKRIADMSDAKKEKCIKIVSINEARYRLNLAKEYKRVRIAKEQIIWLAKLKRLNARDCLNFLLTIV